MAPKINKFGDMVIAEVFGLADSNFMYTEYIHFDEDEVAYLGQVKKEKLKISLEEAAASLAPIPDEEIYAELPPDADYTIAPDDISGLRDVLYLKRPKLDVYDDYKEQNALHVLRRLMLEEARALHVALRHPHPNIIRYYGCRVRRGRITALVFDKHPHCLREYLLEKVGTVDKEPFMAALESAVRHLHARGLAHNDINPGNILIDAKGMPVLTDFGSCAEIGQKLGISRGTPGWVEGDIEDYTTSEARHDTWALEKLRAWLDDPKPNLRS